MNAFKTLIAATAALISLPALAHDGVHIEDAYARSNGAIGGTGAVFFVVQNHQMEDDRLVSVTTDVAQMAELHTHKETADGVMQMMAVPEGVVIPANDSHALARGGDHIMLMGLTRVLADGDTISLTLTFERAGEVVVEAVVDNARKEGGMGAMKGMTHSAP